MTNINLQGIDQTTGKMRPVVASDTLVTSSGETLVGVTGIRGATGLSGPTGLQGDSGATGIIGATGIRGVTGLRGQTGPIISGSTGIAGATGLATPGVTGVQGFGVYAFLTGATTLNTLVRIIGCDTSNAFTVTLPLASTAGVAKEYWIYDETGNASNNNITVVRSGSDTLNGETSYVLDSNYELVKIYSNGSNYFYRTVKGVTGVQGVTGI